MKYQKVQGYRVAVKWAYQTQIAIDRIIKTEWVELIKGLLIMKPGFCFEPSGPTIKTKSIMRGCCAHDAIYYLIRNGHLKPYWKEPADDLMREIHLKDNVIDFRASYFHWFVVNFGKPSVDPRNRKKVKTAP